MARRATLPERSDDTPVMFEPQSRISIYDIVRPPAGYAIDALVACTYSAALDTVLSLPAAMLADLPGMTARRPGTFSAVELAALRRVCDRTLIFCQAGAIHPADQLPPAIIEAERMVFEVRAPMGGTFHPKLWVIRFVDAETKRSILRLAILSRNLTADRSWDLGLVVDSRGSRGAAKTNDIGTLLRAMPGWGRRTLHSEQRRMIATLADDVETARWRLPDGLGAITFQALGTGPGRIWKQPDNDRLLVISPFLTTSAVRSLAASSRDPVMVISRAEALDRCWGAARDGFGRQAVLAAPEDPVNAGRAQLHGKALVWEVGRRTRMAIGSMNATSAAMNGRNVEFMAILDCGKALGDAGMDALLDRRSLGAVIEDFEPPESVDEKPAPFDDRPARAALWDAKLHVACTVSNDGWQIALVADGSIDTALAVLLPSLRYRPATLSANRTAECGSFLIEGMPAPFPGSLALSEITGFIVFEADGPDGLIAFTLNLEVRGVDDAERRAAALRALLPDRQHFADFLRILLGDFSGLEGLAIGDGAGGVMPPWRAASKGGLLELLIRCAADDPGRLGPIREVLDGLETEELRSITPENFSALWQSVLQAAGMRA